MKRKIRILHLINELEPAGAEILLADFARFYDPEVFVVWVAFLDGPGTLKERIESAGVEVIDLSRRGRKHPLMLFKILLLLRKLNPDILHTHLVLASVIGSLAGKIARIGILISTRHYDHHESIRSFRFVLDRYCTRYFDTLVVVSKEIERIVRDEERLRVRNIKIIHNGTDVDFFNSNIAQARALDDQMVIGTIGRLRPQKGYQTFLNVVSYLAKAKPEVIAEIIGVGNDEQILRQSCDSLGITQRVRFLGGVSREKLNEIISGWRVFILSSNWEAFGIAVIEAMSMELPVVVSRVGGLPEIVRDGIDGFLVQPGDVDGFVEKVLYLLEHPSEAAQMGKNGRQRVIENFSIQKMVREYEELYLNLMESKYIRKRNTRPSSIWN